MKRTKILFLTMISLCLVFALSGCSVFGVLNEIVDWIQGEDGLGQTRKRAEALRIEYSETMIDCFKRKNGAGLKEILCPKTQQLSDLDGQIAEGFDFIEGNIIEYTVSPEMKGEEMGLDYGVVTLFAAYGDILSVKTDVGKWYEISFHMYYVVRNADRKGVTRIVLRDTNNTNDYDENNACYEDDTYFTIGYAWNESYYSDSFGLAYQAIKAISDEDNTALKAAFCEQSLANGTIESEIQSAFALFEGKAIFGEVQHLGEAIYDGNHDFNLSVCTDRVVVEENREVMVYVDVYTVNIETDTGKIYEMEWSGYLKNEKEPNLVGMLYLTLIDGEHRITVGEKP